MPGFDLKIAQKTIAAMSDKILAFQQEYGRLVNGYGEMDIGLFRLQAKVLGNRIEEGIARLKECQECLSGTRDNSEAVSIQIAASNILVLSQMAETLDQMVGHSDQINSKLSLAKKIKEEEEIERIRSSVKGRIL